jgi:hypothetical protein
MDCQKLQNLCISVCNKTDKTTNVLMNNDNDNIYLPVKINSNECLQIKEVYNICCKNNTENDFNCCNKDNK